MPEDHYTPNPSHTILSARALIDALDRDSEELARTADKIRRRRRRLLRRLSLEGRSLACDRCHQPGAAFRRTGHGLLCADCMTTSDAAT